MFSIYLSIYLSLHPSIHPTIHPSIYLSRYLSIYPSIYLSISVKYKKNVSVNGCGPSPFPLRSKARRCDPTARPRQAWSCPNFWICAGASSLPCLGKVWLREIEQIFKTQFLELLELGKPGFLHSNFGPYEPGVDPVDLHVSPFRCALSTCRVNLNAQCQSSAQFGFSRYELRRPQ